MITDAAIKKISIVEIKAILIVKVTFLSPKRPLLSK